MRIYRCEVSIRREAASAVLFGIFDLRFPTLSSRYLITFSIWIISDHRALMPLLVIQCIFPRAVFHIKWYGIAHFYGLDGLFAARVPHPATFISECNLRLWDQSNGRYGDSYLIPFLFGTIDDLRFILVLKRRFSM